MRCEQALAQLSARLDRRPEDPWNHALDTHLRRCVACNHASSLLWQTRTALATLPRPVPSTELAARAFAASVRAAARGGQSVGDLFFSWGLRASLAACATAIMLLLVAAKWAPSSDQSLPGWENDRARLSEDILGIRMNDTSSG